MGFTLITKNGEQSFDKELVTISSKPGFDVQLELGFDYILAVQFDSKNNVCNVLNQTNTDKLLFKNLPLPSSLSVDKFCKIMTDNPSNYLIIRVDEALNKVELKNNIALDLPEAQKKLEERKKELESARVAIIKQVQYGINDIKRRISINSKSNIIIQIALFVASLILSFGLCNYLTGLPLKDAGNVIQMPVNLKLILLYSLVVFGIGIMLKEAASLSTMDVENKTMRNILLVLSTLFYSGVYVINLLYYMAPSNNILFAVFVSLFFVLGAASLACASGYFKGSNINLNRNLSKLEYREDFEEVTKGYQQWIERFINSLSDVKINKLKDKLFTLQLKQIGEILLGVLTAPFLAYGVSNTLAMCFPEAAGWIRISGLRFSPVFLVLASFMIIFAFFAFAGAFFANRKIQNSNVLKNDGFSDYMSHGIEIYGLFGIKKLEADSRHLFTIGIVIIFIEFSMNISYFMQEMGSDLRGILISMIAALVPTALLIAETYMLSETKQKTNIVSSILESVDRE